ncbi:MAG TPA: mercuric transporter MerT family protein [Gemmatimonadaceae bacterium]|nr:mercuric transporter MerT family protein [Gemmatimonadaceae bacterium]
MSRRSLETTGTAAGGLVAAVVALFAALCCVGPSVVAIIGAGGALAAAELGRFRPWLLLVSGVLIAYGFWRTYGQVVFANGRTCPVRVGRGARTLLWIAAAAWLVAAVIPRS